MSPAGSMLPVLLQPDKADESELAYYRARLDDPALILLGAAVQLGGGRYLAVPVGGRRRGGYLSVADVITGMAVRGLLGDHPGFPDVRLRWSRFEDACHTVEWGAPAPEADDPVKLGRFYGYSDEAVARFQAERGPSLR